MNKRIIGVFLAVLLILSVLAGCGSGKSGSTAAARGSGEVAPRADIEFGKPVTAETTVAATDGDVSLEFSGDKSVEGEAPSLVGGAGLSSEVTNAILNERKMIRSANITVEVENFDEAYGELNTILLGIGFIQETNINTEKVAVDNKQKLVKSGTIVIRVDKNKFDSVLNNIKGIGEVYNWSISGQDVTNQYIDVESRLRLLKLEEEKLVSYIEKLTDLEQIFKMESQLTDIRQQIESLTVNLKKMSDLVELSTIDINIREKYPGQVEPAKEKTYGERLLDNLTDSLKGVVNFCGELLIILVAALPVLILLGVIAMIVIFIYRRIPKKVRTSPAGQNPPSRTPEQKSFDVRVSDSQGPEDEKKE